MPILAGIESLMQHLLWFQQPEEYRPERCPHCGKQGLWQHGCYADIIVHENVAFTSKNRAPMTRTHSRKQFTERARKV